jgi:DNA-binding response OmpR family regulator
MTAPKRVDHIAEALNIIDKVFGGEVASDPDPEVVVARVNALVQRLRAALRDAGLRELADDWIAPDEGAVTFQPLDLHGAERLLRRLEGLARHAPAHRW